MENISKNKNLATKSRRAKHLCRIWADLYRDWPAVGWPVTYREVKILLFAGAARKPEGTERELKRGVELNTL